MHKSTREQRGEKEPNTVASSASRDPTGPKPLIGGCTWGTMTVRSGPLAAIKKSRPDLATMYSKSIFHLQREARSPVVVRDSGGAELCRPKRWLQPCFQISRFIRKFCCLQGAWVSTEGLEDSFSASQAACSATTFGFYHEHGVTETQRSTLPRSGVYEKLVGLSSACL